MGNSSSVKRETPLLPSPTNFIHVSRKPQRSRSFIHDIISFFLVHIAGKPRVSDIQGTYVVDPVIVPPKGMFRSSLSPTSGDECWSDDEDIPPISQHRSGKGKGIVVPPRPKRNRKNLKLVAEDGRIDVDVHLIPFSASPTLNEPSTINLTLQSACNKREKHPIIARIHAPAFRSPIHLTARSYSLPREPTYKFNNNHLLVPVHSPPKLNNNSVYLHLPRTFQGPIIVHVESGNLADHIRLSNMVENNCVVMREDGFTRGIFVSSPSGERCTTCCGLINVNSNNPPTWQGEHSSQLYDTGLKGFHENSSLLSVSTLTHLNPGDTAITMEETDGCCCKHLEQSAATSSTSGSTNMRGKVKGQMEEETRSDWKGDRVEILVESGMVWIQFEDEEKPKALYSRCISGLGGTIMKLFKEPSTEVVGRNYGSIQVTLGSSKSKLYVE